MADTVYYSGFEVFQVAASMASQEPTSFTYELDSPAIGDVVSGLRSRTTLPESGTGTRSVRFKGFRD